MPYACGQWKLWRDDASAKTRLGLLWSLIRTKIAWSGLFIIDMCFWLKSAKIRTGSFHLSIIFSFFDLMLWIMLYQLGYTSTWYTCIIRLFGYCNGGTSGMRNYDWSTLDIGKSWKWGLVLFKSNCIILRYYLSMDAKHIILSLKNQQTNCIWKCLFNISIEANIVNPDQEQSGLDFDERQKHTFCNYLL